MNLQSIRFNIRWSRRIQLLSLLKWPVLVLPALLAWGVWGRGLHGYCRYWR